MNNENTHYDYDTHIQQENKFKAVKGSPLAQNQQLPLGQGLWLSDQIKIYDNKITMQLDINQPNRLRVQKIYPSLNNTYVVLFQGLKYKISHVDSQGKEIRCFRAQNYIKALHMIEPTVVIALVCNQKWEESLLQWDIQSNKKVMVPLPPLPSNSQGAQLELFKESKTACLIYVQSEKRQKFGRRDVLKRELFKTISFQLPLQSQQDPPILYSNYTVKKEVLYSNMKLIKIDEISKLALIPEQMVHETEPMIVILDNSTKQWIELYLKNFTNPCPDLCSLYIEKVWEFEPGVLYINTRTEIDIYYKMKHRNDVQNKLEDIQKNYAYVWEYNKGNMRPTNFTITEDHQVHLLGGLQQPRKAIRKRLDLHGRYMQAYTQYQGDYNLIVLPLFYIDMQTQKILGIDRSVTPNPQSLNNYKCQVVPYAKTMQFNYLVDYEGRAKVAIRRIDYIRFKLNVMVTWMLEHLLEGWDIDLLMHVTELV